MSIANFNLFNKFCFDEADETLSHVSNYCSLNNISSNLSYINNNVSFSILHNIRSITKTEGKLEELLEELRVLRVYVFPCTSTITALSETNFNPNKLNKINIDGFKFVFSNEFKKKKKVYLCSLLRFKKSI